MLQGVTWLTIGREANVRGASTRLQQLLVSRTFIHATSTCNNLCEHEGQLSRAPDCLSANLCSFILLVADDSLTTPLRVLPAAPVNMAGPSLSTLDELQKQLNQLNELVIAEFRKGANRDEGLVAELRQEKNSLVAQLDRHTSGEVQHHVSVLSSITCPRLKSMHTHEVVSWASWKSQATGEVWKCCGPPSRFSCSQWSVSAKTCSCWAGSCSV